MSLTYIVSAFKAKTGNPLRKLILIKLADNANDEGICWPSYQHIADHCEISKRSAIAHIKALEEEGFLIKQTRKKERGVNFSNCYQLVFNSESPASPSANRSLGGESPALPPSESPAPRTSNYIEPSKEPVKEPRQKPSGLIANSHLEQELINYRKAIKKPLKTRKGLTGLINSIEKTAKAWGVHQDLVKDYMMQKEWQSIDPSYSNPYQQNTRQQKTANNPPAPAINYFTAKPAENDAEETKRAAQALKELLEGKI